MWSERRFLAAAIVLHFTIPVAAAVAPAYEPAGWLTAKRSEPQEIDVDLDSAMLPETSDPSGRIGVPHPSARMEERSRAERPMSHRVLMADPADGTQTTDPENTFIEPPADATPSPDGPGGEYYQPPGAGEVHTPGYGPPGAGLGYIPPDDGYDPTPAPTVAPARPFDPRQADKAINAGINEKDRKLGLDFPGRGVVKNAFTSAVYASDAPYECSGRFTVKVNGKGKITDVSLGGFSGGDAHTWQQVKKQAKAALAGATLPMKSRFAKGAVLGVVVRSAVKAAGGGTARDGLQLSFDVTDAVAKPVRSVTASVSVTPVE
jgi:hypothetical protein